MAKRKAKTSTLIMSVYLPLMFFASELLSTLLFLIYYAETGPCQPLSFDSSTVIAKGAVGTPSAAS